MKRKNKSQVQSEAKRKWDAQKEVSKNWPPFPLKEDGCYPGSKDPERIWCAFKALNWLIDVAFHQEEIERGAKGLWYSELYQEQYMEALEEASDINMTWTGWGIKLPTVPVANNTNRLRKEDFFSLRQWFQIVCQLVNTDIQAHEKQATASVEADIHESDQSRRAMTNREQQSSQFEYLKKSGQPIKDDNANMSKPKFVRRRILSEEIVRIDDVTDDGEPVTDNGEPIVDERTISSQIIPLPDEDVLPADTNDRTAPGKDRQAKSRTGGGKAGHEKRASPETTKLKVEPIRDQVFICYSHKDDRWLADLQTHLTPYVRNGSMTAWSDKQIAPGSKWFPEIQAALAATKVAVLLVTPNFLASDFIHEHELTPLLKEAEKDNVRIIWIPVRACSYKETPLRDYQAAIDPDKPLANMKAERDKAWVKICEKIKEAVRR